MAKRVNQLRWTIEKAATEFGINSKTITTRLTSNGIKPEVDGQFSTKQICDVVFGDLSGARLRKELALASQEERRDKIEAKEYVKAADVEAVWIGYLSHIKEVIGQSELAEHRKQEILTQLREIPRSEFFQAKLKPEAEEEDEG